MKMKGVCGVLVFAIFVAFLSISSLALEADVDFLIGDEMMGNGPCCDQCFCTRSIPPQCRCADVKKTYCHPSCKGCICTRSIPPQCRCTDIKNYCDKPCSTIEYVGK